MGGAAFEGAGYKRDNRVGNRQLASGIIDSPADVGGWPRLNSAPAPADSDHDGMPDDWERRMGLDAAEPSDRNRMGAHGYTMLEIYLNDLVEKALPSVGDGAVQTD